MYSVVKMHSQGKNNKKFGDKIIKNNKGKIIKIL